MSRVPISADSELIGQRAVCEYCWLHLHTSLDSIDPHSHVTGRAGCRRKQNGSGLIYGVQ
jgi:hypothetical protein